ncbi:MAG: hypothetical protein GVY07_08465 [Bacteroidetes bacterium]|nr:hypothetical protein [Bacteroidota bacterium]
MTQPTKSEWPATFRLLFKFLLLYLVFHIIPMQLLFEDLVLWFGRTIIGVEGEIPTNMTGSGDMTINWLTFAFNLIVAAISTAIWTAIDRNRVAYPKTAEGLYILARYYLAATLLSYGLVKIFPLQFPEPSLILLTQEYGDSSPMGLAWTFLGFSTGYQVFAGFSELLAALLLFFRRTTLLGALVAAGVMTNVFMINMFFDVPVKLFSAHLLLIAVSLAALNAKPLWDFFVMGKRTMKNSYPLPVEDREWRIIAYTAQFIVIAGLLGSSVYANSGRYFSQPDPPGIAGVYEVLDFEHAGQVIDPRKTNKKRWDRVVIDNKRPGLMAIDYMTGHRVRFRAELSEDVDSLTAEVPTNPTIDPQVAIQLNASWNQRYDNQLELRGTLGPDSLIVRMEKRSMDDIQLISRGFNWVNEYPFNR